eukprot:1052316_1
MSLTNNLFLVIATIAYRSSSADICTTEFIGTPGKEIECVDYGFCSSCVSSGTGCTWCEPTSRCVKHNNDCAKHEAFGLTSLTQCTEQYANNNQERPNIATTDYSPQLSEILMVYARYAVKPKQLDDGTW